MKAEAWKDQEKEAKKQKQHDLMDTNTVLADLIMTVSAGKSKIALNIQTNNSKNELLITNVLSAWAQEAINIFQTIYKFKKLIGKYRTSVSRRLFFCKPVNVFGEGPMMPMHFPLPNPRYPTVIPPHTQGLGYRNFGVWLGGWDGMNRGGGGRALLLPLLNTAKGLCTKRL